MADYVKLSPDDFYQTATTSFVHTEPLTRSIGRVPASGKVPTSTGMTVSERAERWYYVPLEGMGVQNGLIILMVIIPLYERFLRHAHSNYAGATHFASPIVQDVARTFSLKPDQAAKLWDVIRNGLLHRAAPKEGINVPRYNLERTGNPVTVDGLGQFHINPFALRDMLIARFRAHPAFLSDPSEYPLPDEWLVKG